ncbi:MAG TPA: tyrosine-type recombinase/integrase [Bradyrhizobium sp.]|nr:tyrosine-type recombinase/integrase [Bradyrhizobium sp.]
MLPGLHKVRPKLAGGMLGEYWYAWRGGPRILAARGATERELEREVGRLTQQAVLSYRAVMQPSHAADFLTGLIGRYLESGEFKKLGPRRQSDLTKALDIAKVDDIGLMPVKALESPKARKALIDWRDRYKATPCTADARLGAVAAVTKWALERGEISVNPLVSWPRIYASNRADKIWTPAELAQLLPKCKPDFALAVRFAALTALRVGDLVKIPVSAIGEDAIVWHTGKSRGRKTIVIPITDELRTLIAELPKHEVGAALTHSRGSPWTVAGLQTAMQRAKRDAAIKGLTFHDLRGTGATRLAVAGMPLEDISWILGWKKERVEQIIVRYVTGEAIGRGMVARLAGRRKG